MHTITFLCAVLWTLLPACILRAQEIGTDSGKPNPSSYFLQMQLGGVAFATTGSGDPNVFAHTFMTIGCVGKISIIPSMGTYWRISTGVSNKLPYFIEWRDEAFYLLDVNLLVDFNEHDAIPYMSSSLSGGISLIKPFDDTYPVKDFGSTTESWRTSNWLNTLHLYFALAFRFHPSMIEMFVRIPWYDSIEMYSNYLGAMGPEGHMFFGICYSYMIRL